MEHPLNAVYRIGDGAKREVGSFCCPVLPVPLESPSVARWGPTALKLCNFSPLGRQLRGNRERLVIVGTCVYEPSRWHPYRSAIASLLHSSILFRPHQQPREIAGGGGGAGVLPPGSEVTIPRNNLPT